MDVIVHLAVSLSRSELMYTREALKNLISDFKSSSPSARIIALQSIGDFAREGIAPLPLNICDTVSRGK